MWHGNNLPSWINHIIPFGKSISALSEQDKAELCQRLSRFNHPSPEVSIVIPVFNEENNLIATLDSLSYSQSNKAIEIVLVDNNSTDGTIHTISSLGLSYTSQTIQSVSFTRQKGLEVAKGAIIINCDADTIYPPLYIDILAKQLETYKSISCVYTRYSFLPSEFRTRLDYLLYEKISGLLFTIRRRRKEYLNVMGFCFAFRKADALKIGGFNTSRPLWSDGWMAMKLLKLGNLKLITDEKTRVFTSDRRLQVHGSLWKAFVFRVKKEKSRITEYFLFTTLKPN
jgi:glycosyltransferase involved in cell wall biosynthesis